MYWNNIKILTSTFIISSLFITKGQISPGELTNAHSKLEGMSNCTKCHILGEQVSNAKCLDCHTEINSLIKSNRGYHSSNEVKGKNCFQCHSEHHGRNFKIINFNANSFNHKLTGYELTGAHTKAECKDCHSSKNLKDEKIKSKKSTWLGLNNSCSSCHADYHQTTLGNNCENCHTTNSFRPAEKFNHSNSKFLLTGKHLEASCEKCHKYEKRNNKDFQVFVGIQFNSCENCHRDIHEGKFGKDCTTCHNTNSFKQVKTSSFDHNKTLFPLLGKHVNLNCNQCHGNNLSSKPKHQNCLDCHNDYHKGEFVKNNNQTDCSSCHTVEGFSPSIFTIERHNEIEFKLIGSHLAVPCKSCHYKETEWKFKNIEKECYHCHKNVHGDELTTEFLPNNNCNICHSVYSWQDVNFNHSKTNFELTGKHSSVTCNKCHLIEKEYKFRSLNKDCISCHIDKHKGQFDIDGTTDCLKCHGFNNWRAEKFNHENTMFPLTGGHQKVPCANCHKDKFIDGELITIYKVEKFKCSDCHS